MTLNYFSEKPADDGGKRYRAIGTVRAWLWGKSHLPPDLVKALELLIPELRKGKDPHTD